MELTTEETLNKTNIEEVEESLEINEAATGIVASGKCGDNLT